MQKIDINEVDSAIDKFTQVKRIPVTQANVRYLYTLSKAFRSVYDNKKGSRTRLYTLLCEGFPNSKYQAGYRRLTASAMKGAVGRIHFMRQFEFSEYDMHAMFTADAADHLNLALQIDNSASKSDIEKLLWTMDTASREEVDSKILDWVYGR